MADHEIVIRIVLEQANNFKAVTAPEKKSRTHKKTMPRDFYPKVDSLNVGEVLEASQVLNEMGITLRSFKDRLAAWRHWKNKQDNGARTYMVAKAGNRVQVARIH